MIFMYEVICKGPCNLVLSSFAYCCLICRSLGKDKCEKVNEMVPHTIGYLSCLYGASNVFDDPDRSSCKLFFMNGIEKHTQKLNLVSRGFWCPLCGKKELHHNDQCSVVLHMPHIERMADVLDFDFLNLQALFFRLLFDESSEEVQVACVGVIPRILKHGTKEILLNTRLQWINCIDYLLIHKKKAVRDAFCMQISCFLEDHILDSLFVDEESQNKTKEQKFLDKLKHSLSATEDLQIFQTLLESTAEIMNTVDIHGQLFFFSLILLVDQLDNHHLTVRITASRLIHRSCYFHLKGGFELILSRFIHIRDELFDYLCTRLVCRPIMIREFAEAVVGIETEELIKKMVPVVLPKLIVTHQDNDQSAVTLNELAKHLNIDVVPLIVNWLPKVLAFFLLRSDGQELFSALQFYHMQTGSDNKEICAAALPALLDELVCFSGDGDSDETNKR